MSIGSATLTDITSADWSLTLDAPGEPGTGIGNVVQGIADVNQCICIILTTPKGSDPLRPTFGADVWRYIDTPIDTALPSIVREVTEAITRWEPRVTVVSITAIPVLNEDAQSGAHLNITVSWRLKLSTRGLSTSSFGPLQSTAIAISTP
jgi:uncharacterized protein